MQSRCELHYLVPKFATKTLPSTMHTSTPRRDSTGQTKIMSNLCRESSIMILISQLSDNFSSRIAKARWNLNWDCVWFLGLMIWRKLRRRMWRSSRKDMWVMAMELRNDRRWDIWCISIMFLELWFFCCRFGGMWWEVEGTILRGDRGSGLSLSCRCILSDIPIDRIDGLPVFLFCLFWREGWFFVLRERWNAFLWTHWSLFWLCWDLLWWSSSSSLGDNALFLNIWFFFLRLNIARFKVTINDFAQNLIFQRCFDWWLLFTFPWSQSLHFLLPLFSHLLLLLSGSFANRQLLTLSYFVFVEFVANVCHLSFV